MTKIKEYKKPSLVCPSCGDVDEHQPGGMYPPRHYPNGNIELRCGTCIDSLGKAYDEGELCLRNQRDNKDKKIKELEKEIDYLLARLDKGDSDREALYNEGYD